jgi:hypothetical protein
VLNWIHSRLDGMRLDTLPTSKRVQLASACLHIAVEHAQAIVVLVDNGLFGSALAMQRPLVEAYCRGKWLLSCATDAQVDGGGRDRFPDMSTIMGDLEKVGLPMWVGIKQQWWSRMCSLTHTGFQQIGARLTPEGLGYGYDEAEMVQGLGWADALGCSVLSASPKWRTTSHWRSMRSRLCVARLAMWNHRRQPVAPERHAP